MTWGKGLFMFCYLPPTLIFVENYAGTQRIFRFLSMDATCVVITTRENYLHDVK